MTLQEYINHVRKVLDEYETDISFWTDDELRKWLNEGLMEVSKITKFLTQRAFIEPTTESEYPLPDDFIEAYKVKVDGVFEDPITMEEDGEETGYYIWGKMFFLSEFPDDSRIVMYYYRTAKKMEILTEEPELPVEYEDIIIPFCLYRAFMKDRRSDEANLAQQKFYERVRVMKGKYDRQPNNRQWKVVR